MVDDTALGYIGVSIAVVFFGSYAVPVKLIKTGDGVFFQWVSDLNESKPAIILIWAENKHFKHFRSKMVS